MNWVYFIKPIGLDGPIKIGHSWRPSNRLVDLGAWSPWPLELIGSVPGLYTDEQFLHRCFSDIHSHREWFHSTPELRATIAAILAAGSVDAARSALTPKGSIRNRDGVLAWTPDRRLRASYSSRIRHARNKLREIVGEDGAWWPSDDVRDIESRWEKKQPPTEGELARLNDYLKDPAAYSAVSPWHQKSVAA